MPSNYTVSLFVGAEPCLVWHLAHATSSEPWRGAMSTSSGYVNKIQQQGGEVAYRRKILVQTAVLTSAQYGAHYLQLTLWRCQHRHQTRPSNRQKRAKVPDVSPLSTAPQFEIHSLHPGRNISRPIFQVLGSATSATCALFF